MGDRIQSLEGMLKEKEKEARLHSVQVHTMMRKVMNESTSPIRAKKVKKL